MQLFKANDEELKVVDAVGPAFDLTSAALDEMFENGDDSDPFLLMLYDNELVPYSERIKRDSYVNFYRAALERFPYAGTFEAYLFILRSIFGDDVEVVFTTATAGGLDVSMNIANEVTFDFIGSDSSGEFELIASDGANLVFRSISGFESEHDVELLFSELVPAGIILNLSVNFYEYSNFVAEKSSTLYDVVDGAGNNIIFYEVGG